MVSNLLWILSGYGVCMNNHYTHTTTHRMFLNEVHRSSTVDFNSTVHTPRDFSLFKGDFSLPVFSFLIGASVVRRLCCGLNKALAIIAFTVRDMSLLYTLRAVLHLQKRLQARESWYWKGTRQNRAQVNNGVVFHLWGQLLLSTINEVWCWTCSFTANHHNSFWTVFLM